MSSLVYTSASTQKDLEGIIALQKNNLAVNLTADEIATQGFVTVVHSLQQLQKMNGVEQHIICKDGDTVVAYLLAMTKESKNDIPVLVPMFELFDQVMFEGKPVAAYNYIVIGQACVDRNYRGIGVLDNCYATYKAAFANKYDFAITEIATANQRSIKAHQRIGFTEIHQYTAATKQDWSIVIYKW